jgi:hypothetical protein
LELHSWPKAIWATHGQQKSCANVTDDEKACDVLARRPLTQRSKVTNGRRLFAKGVGNMCLAESEDSTEPDIEVLAALRPCVSTIPGSMLRFGRFRCPLWWTTGALSKDASGGI